ncbi:hypothetical protein HAX54_000681, partial [Datura stramonium]|nr:hypothetical protein [Datura stramonium]
MSYLDVSGEFLDVSGECLIYALVENVFLQLVGTYIPSQLVFYFPLFKGISLLDDSLFQKLSRSLRHQRLPLQRRGPSCAPVTAS